MAEGGEGDTLSRTISEGGDRDTLSIIISEGREGDTLSRSKMSKVLLV